MTVTDLNQTLNTRKTLDRKRLLRKYCLDQKIKITPGVNLCRPETELTVVTPAFNEQDFIVKTLRSLEKIQNNIEIVVVDNGSSDQTRDVVLELSRGFKHPLVLLNSRQKGPVFARKRGMDEVVAQYLERGKMSNPRYLAMLDADTVVPQAWVEKISQTFRKTNASALGGRYYYPRELDLIIEKALGIKDYFKEIPGLAYFLSSYDACLILTYGNNSAIEVGAYMSIGGSQQPHEEDGNPVKGSDLRFGDALRALGRKVAFLPVMVETSARREIYALSQGIEQNKISSMEGWVDCREPDKELLKKIISHLRRQDLIRHNEERKTRFVMRNIMIPLLLKQLSIEGLVNLLGTSSTSIRLLNKAIMEIKDKSIKEVRFYADTVLGPQSRVFLSEIRGVMISRKYNFNDIIGYG